MDLPGKRIGDFELIEKVGGGGSGQVYRSRQRSMGRDVAIKWLKGGDRRQKTRFEREALLSTLIRHNNALHVYACGSEADGDWIAMELVPGVSFDKWLAAHGPVSLDDFLPFFELLADVVHELHELEIIHRDIKLSNVMVFERRGRLIPKLLDLGIAKVSPALARRLKLPADDDDAPAEIEVAAGGDMVTISGTTLTPSRVGMGSMHCMPPEQWTNPRDAVPESDVYALMIFAYQALTGRLPFNATTAAGMREAHLFKRPLSIGGELAADLDPIFQRGLAKKPEDRFHSPLELVSELRRVQKVRNARRTVLMRRLVLGLAAALAIALVLGGVAFVRQDRAQTRAQIAEEQARSARRQNEVLETQREVDHGQNSLLANKHDAEAHLATASQRGDRSPGLLFMWARALESYLATVAWFPSSYRRMWYVAYSPDGTRIVTTDDHNAQVWDAKTHARLHLLPHDSEVYQALYTPDGLLVTVSRTLRVWSPDGKLVRELKPPHAGTPSSYYIAALSPDGKSIVAMDDDGALAQVWDFASGAPRITLPSVEGLIADLAFSADGHWLAITGGVRANVFDTQTWKLQATIPDVYRLAFAPTASLLLTGTSGGQLAIWTPRGTLVRQLIERGEKIDTVAWSPDGELVVAGGVRGLEQIYATSGALKSKFVVHDSPTLQIEFDRTSSRTVVTSMDGSVIVADVATGAPVAVFETQARAPVAHFDATSQRVIAASWDGTARIWDATSSYRRWAFAPVSKDCRLVTSEQPGRYVAAACRDHSTNVWDIQSDRLITTLPVASLVNDELVAPVISAAMDKVAIARGSTAEIYALPSGQLLATVSHLAPVSALGFLREDLVSGSIDGALRLTHSNGASTEFPSRQGIDALETLLDGRIVVADNERQLRVYDREGNQQATVQLPVRAGSLRTSGTSVVVVPHFDEGAVPPVLIDLSDNRIVAQLDCYVGRTNQALWTEDNQILTAGDKVCRWDGETGKLLQSYDAGPRPLSDVTSSRELVIAGDVTGKLWFWDPTDSTPLWSLQAHSSRLERVLWQMAGSIETLGADGAISRWMLPDPKSVIDRCEQRKCTMLPK